MRQTGRMSFAQVVIDEQVLGASGAEELAA
jgi:hypothetical protein